MQDVKNESRNFESALTRVRSFSRHLACFAVFLAGTTALSQGPIPNTVFSNSDGQDVSLTQQGVRGTSPNQTQAGLGQTAASQRGSDPNEDRTGRATTLSTNQIIEILHEKPEVIVDLKRVMVDFFAKQGVAVQEDSITDEMLFSNVAATPGLRRMISVWLRARGYALDADFSRSTEPDDSDSDISPDRRRLPDQDSDSLLTEDENAGSQSQLALALRNLPPDSEILPQDSLQDSSIPAASRSGLERQAAPLDSTRMANGEAKPTSVRNPLSPTSPLREKKEPDPNKIDVLHQPAPYNLEALRDLYTQVPEQTAIVKRFGSDVFLTRGMATREMPIDLPIGPDYVLGPGDGLTISLWGSVSQSFTRVIDREGKLVLPEAGSIVVAGLTLERTQALVQGALSQQFKDAKVAVSVAHLRTVRVYVVGDVQRPGAYDISSLSTPLNALYAAGGPTSVGSLRTVRHFRGNTLIREVDLYDFLLHGIRADVERLEPGDTVLVPAAGPQVEVSGMVKRPAIYEFKGQTKLSGVIDEAGGLRAMAALTHIRVERIEAEGHRVTIEVDLPKESTPESARKQMDAFTVKDGDRVVIAPIVPYSEKAIYMTGHVVRPGKLPYREGMKLSDAIRSYQDLLPEPSDHGELIRLMPPDLRPEAIDFSVTEVLAGSTAINLQPFDTIRVLGRYEADGPTSHGARRSASAGRLRAGAGHDGSSTGTHCRRIQTQCSAGQRRPGQL